MIIFGQSNRIKPLAKIDNLPHDIHQGDSIYLHTKELSIKGIVEEVFHDIFLTERNEHDTWIIIKPQ